MTNKEFFEYRDKVLKQAEEDYTLTKSLWEDNKPIEAKFLNSHTIRSDELDLVTMGDVLNIISEFKDEISNLPYHINGKELSVEVCSDDNDYMEDNYFSYKYECLVDKDIYDRRIENEIKQWFTEQLRTDTAKYTEQVDCKLMELFKDGSIDFKTLQKLVYTNCGL